MSIGGENYEKSIIPVRSEVSRFSRGTVLDCVEDGSLLRMLFHGPSDLAAGIARISASGKFSFLLLGLGYIAMSLL